MEGWPRAVDYTGKSEGGKINKQVVALYCCHWKESRSHTLQAFLVILSSPTEVTMSQVQLKKILLYPEIDKAKYLHLNIFPGIMFGSRKGNPCKGTKFKL